MERGNSMADKMQKETKWCDYIVFYTTANKAMLDMYRKACMWPKIGKSFINR